MHLVIGGHLGVEVEVGRGELRQLAGPVAGRGRDHVRGKTDTAMTNEMLCKFLCHNLCCLVSAIYELGIDPVFWGDRTDGPTAILKFPGVG